MFTKSRSDEQTVWLRRVHFIKGLFLRRVISELKVSQVMAGLKTIELGVGLQQSLQVTERV
jgi:hypothetical protein